MQQPDYTLLDKPELLQFMFYPRHEWYPPPDGATDHELVMDDGLSLSARLYVEDKAAPTILFFHGNGEVACEYDGIASFYRRIGMNLFVADYRGYGRSEGYPTVSALVTDSHATLRGLLKILREGGYTGPVFVMGRSLGAYSAVELAAGHPDELKGVIIESGSASISRVMVYFKFDQSPEIRALDRMHWAKVQSISIPLLIMHGDRDALVPIERGRELYEAVSSREKEFVTIGGAGHNDIMLVDTEGYFRAIRDFVFAHR